MSDDKTRGLYGKYIVTKSSDPEDCSANYFVLNLGRDPFALPALKAYAEACAEEYPLLARDLQVVIQGLETHLDVVAR